jgi:hypothetical protein
MNGGPIAGARLGWELALMTTRIRRPLKDESHPRYGIRMFLFIVVLTFIFFLLAQSMVRHRFHEGGWVNRNGSIVP